MDPHDPLLADLRACEAASLAGSPVVGVEIASRALHAAQAAGRRPEAAQAAAWLAEHQLRRGDCEGAVATARAALPEADELGLHVSGIKLRNIWSKAWCQLGKADEALPLVMQALARARTLDEPGVVSRSLTSLAVVVELLGDHPRAIALLHKADDAAARDGDLVARFAAVVNLAGALCRSGRHSTAVASQPEPTPRQVADLRESLAVGRRAAELAQGHPHWQMVCAEIECLALEPLQMLEEMRDAIERHRALALQLRLPEAQAENELLNADWLLAGGRVAEACHALEHRVDATAAQRNDGCRRWWSRSRYRAFKAAGRAAEALQALEELMGQERRDRERSLSAQARVLLGDVEVQIAQQEVEQLRLEAEELRRRADAATQESLLDALTGLANRRALDARLLAALPLDQRRTGIFSVALIDIDHFKQINDGWGHDVGDAVLREIARLLNDSVRSGDFVARTGGEEFVILFGDQVLHEASAVCERLRQCVQAHDWSRFVPGRTVTISIGLTEAQPLDDVTQVIRRADRQMYEAKRGGRNRLAMS